MAVDGKDGCLYRHSLYREESGRKELVSEHRIIQPECMYVYMYRAIVCIFELHI